MSYPDWPEVHVTTPRTTLRGFESTASTKYKKVKLSATENAPTADEAKLAAERALNRQVNKRKSYE